MYEIILLDIEGTTTPIDFVHKTLFPFAKMRVAKHVAANFDRLADQIAELKIEHSRETDHTDEFDATSSRSVAAYLSFLIDIDRKSTPLKSIQGEIWRQGFESGELVSTVFEDVPRAFERWSGQGKRIAIFSSGSVLAQQLLFRYTEHGDLTPWISNYFDTNVGSKRESSSYATIARELGSNAASILFVSDIPAEFEAAENAGMQVALSVRLGNATVEPTWPGTSIHTFDELD